MRIEEFPLAWRWTQESHALLPTDVLETLEPVEPGRARDIYERGERLTASGPQATDATCNASDVSAATKWLATLQVPAETRVTIVWSRELGLDMPWGIFARYWDDFCYPSSDDAFIFIPPGNGLLSYDHEEIFALSKGVA